MPHQEITHRFQTALLWGKTGVDDYGQPTVGSPSQIEVRWEWGNTEIKDPNGNLIDYDATVHVNQEISIGSLMWLGTLVDWSGTGSNDTDTELMRVEDYLEIPDIRNRVSRRMVGLKRWKNTIPD